MSSVRTPREGRFPTVSQPVSQTQPGKRPLCRALSLLWTLLLLGVSAGGMLASEDFTPGKPQALLTITRPLTPAELTAILAAAL